MQRSDCVRAANRDEPSGVDLRLPRQASRASGGINGAINTGGIDTGGMDTGGIGPAGVESDGVESDGIHTWGHAPHRHPHAQLVGAIMGRATITVDGQEFAADPSWAVWIPPGVWHSARFHDRYVPLVHNGGPAHRDRPTAVFVDPELRHALLTADRGPDRPDSPVETALAIALRRSPTGPRVPCPAASGRLTLPIVEALEADPADPRSLEDWALQLHVSSISIRRAFDAEVGLSFTDWRTRARVNAAVVLLDDGESVSATARAVGMSHNGLIAAVRKHLGVTPSSLQRR